MAELVVDPVENEASKRFLIHFAGLNVPALDVIDPTTIRVGRQGTDQDFAASTASFTLRNPSKYYAATEWGAIVWLYYMIAGVAGSTGEYLTRFTGLVTDRSVEWIAGGSAPDQLIPVMHITAVGGLALAARTMLGDTPWPEEIEKERLDRTMYWSGLRKFPWTWRPDPGGMMLAARDVDARDALELSQIASRSGGGLLVEQPDAIEWHDRSHRAKQAVRIRFAPRDVLVTPAIVAIGPVTNRVTVAYGPDTPAGGGDRPEVTATDGSSRDKYGPLDLRVDVETRDQADAQTLADYWLGRRSRAAWGITGLEVELDHPDHPAAVDGSAWHRSVLGLRIANLIAVDGLPAGGPVSSGVLYVEGWTETITATDYRIAFAVSDWSLSNAAQAWRDVDPALRWTDVAAGVTWATWDQAPTFEEVPG